jgi:hypothetical protein
LFNVQSSCVTVMHIGCGVGKQQATMVGPGGVPQNPAVHI